MKKQFLSLLLVMAGMVSWAQSESGWTDPGNAYHQKTVVYATLNCGNMTYGNINPEVAAFIDGEVRAVTSNYQMNDIGNIYTLKVGGNDADMGKEISFKVYDPATGLIYPLEVCNEEGVPLETGITYQGDFSYAVFDETTNMYDITLHTLHATPVEVITVEYASADNPVVPLQVGVETTIEDYVTFNFETASGAEPTMPENPLVWHLDIVDNFGNPTSYYLDIETNSDGFNIATGLNKTNYTVRAGVTIGNGNLGAGVDFVVTQPVTSIEVEDAEIYLGVGRFVPQPVFNGGESEPSNTRFTLSVETEDVVRVVGQAIIPQALGTAVVTATSDENPEISTTFQVAVISALESIDKGFDTDVYEYTRWSAGEEIIDLPNPVFIWLTREDGKPVISNTDETYTITSSDPTVIRIDKQETEEGTEILPMSLKKGTAQITYTSNYDPSKSVTFTVVVKQSVQEIAITEVNGVEIVEMGQTIDVTVGETIVARAEVAPLDADYEEFTMQFVDANWGIVEKIENYVEILSSEVVDGICTFEFKFIEVPETEYFLQAVIDNDIKSPIVGFNVYNVIESIDVYMNEEYWITEDENIFEFKYNVNPGNVLDPSLTVESSNTDVAEVLMSEDAGMYRIHAYSTGEVTFTFTSNANPEVSTQVTTVIKREPTGVAITKVGSIDIPAPGTTPAETVVEVAVGQDVVAVAGIEPNDATYDSFEFRLVNDDDIPYEADVVTIGDRIDNGDGTISIGFTFNSVPDRDVYLKAVVRYSQYDNETSLQHRVRIEVRQGVTDIAVSEEVKTIWFTEGMEEFFTIQATVYPDDATNKNLIINLDGDDVISYEGYSEDGEHHFKIQGKGNATITFTSVDNPSVTATCEVTAKKRVQELMAEGNLNLFNDGENGSLWFGFYPEDADFDPEMLIVNVDSPGMPEDWTALDLIVLDEGENYMNYEIIPRALGYGSIEFSYCNPEDEEAMSYFAEYSVQEKTTVEAGWNWFSLINGEVNIAETLYDMLIEARSQDELVFNDASWGLFGDLINMDNTQAYKLNIHEDYVSEIYLNSEANVEGYIHTKSLKKGWNWVSYPYEFGYDVATIFDASMFSENDMILSKNDGFVQRNADGVWEGGLSELVPYQGYMVYCNADIELDMPGRYELEQGYFNNLAPERAASRERAAWVYDNSRFANSMAIVAKVDVENCEDYTIGAFVGDECRGEGKFINGKAFISVGGESGENISFRLLNKWTGELLDVAQKIPFGDMAGSISAPVLMGTIDGTTGIVDINTIDNNNVEAIYDITGRKVEQMTEGIYVIEVREGDKIVTKKVRK